MRTFSDKKFYDFDPKNMYVQVFSPENLAVYEIMW
jgi:hypothetical protein